MKTYTIPPLEWERTTLTNGRDYWYADTVFGRLEVYLVLEGGWIWRSIFSTSTCIRTHPCDSAEDGKEKAWEHYLSCLLPALKEAS